VNTCQLLSLLRRLTNLFDNFNGGMRVDPGKTLQCPHIDHWTNARMGINSWISLKDGKPASFYRPPSHNGWLIDLIATKHVWKRVKEASFKFIHTRNLAQDPLENTFLGIHSYCCTCLEEWISLGCCGSWTSGFQRVHSPWESSSNFRRSHTPNLRHFGKILILVVPDGKML
jgi:hypothetical protein